TGMRTARRPAAVVSVLATTNSTPPAAKTRPIWPGDAPATCSSAGTRRAETPVVRPAVMMAAAATIVRRLAVAARRLEPIRTGGAGAMARIRSSPRASVSAAKAAATTRNGLTRPKYWTATPDRAGPTTPPAPALATVPPSPGPPGAASASQDSPAVQTTAKPIPNPSRAASRNGNDPATAWVNIATDITPPAQSVSLRAP